MTYTCGESTAVIISCSDSYTLHIVDTFYGVLSCSGMTSTSITISICQGLSSCSFTADNSLFGDPCVGYGKTMVLVYYCV